MLHRGLITKTKKDAFNQKLCRTAKEIIFFTIGPAIIYFLLSSTR